MIYMSSFLFLAIMIRSSAKRRLVSSLLILHQCFSSFKSSTLLIWNPQGPVLPQQNLHLLFVCRVQASSTALNRAEDTGSPCFVPRVMSNSSNRTENHTTHFWFLQSLKRNSTHASLTSHSSSACQIAKNSTLSNAFLKSTAQTHSCVLALQSFSMSRVQVTRRSSHEKPFMKPA